MILKVIFLILSILFGVCVFLGYYVRKKGEIHYHNCWIKIDIFNNVKPDYLEMTVEPTPEWIKSAGKEIQEKYNLDYVEHIYISGIIARHKRINK